MTNGEAHREMTTRELGDKLRGELKEHDHRIRLLAGLARRQYRQAEEAYSGQHNDIHSNILLALHHVEDARMRLGKVMHAIGGGRVT